MFAYGDRLPTREVNRHRRRYTQYSLRLFHQSAFALFKIDITFKRNIQTGIVRFVTNDIDKHRTIFSGDNGW